MNIEAHVLPLLMLLLGFMVSYYLTPPIIKSARFLGFLDIPDERRIHNTPVPRSGGLAIFIGFQVICYLFFSQKWTHGYRGAIPFHWWEAFAISSSLLLIIGLLDDTRSLRWYTKLLGQIAASMVMFDYGFRIAQLQGLTLPLSLDLILTTIWFVGFINAFNLIDGLDGLATGLALIAAAGLAAALAFRRLPGDAILVLGLVSVCFAFLRYNFHPAKIFLGDSGSMFLGFTLAALSIATSSKGTLIASVGVPLFAVGIPLFDTILAVWRRSVRALLKGESSGQVMHADLDHIHHRLMRMGFTQKKVALSLYFANALFVGVGILSLVYHSRATGIFVLTFVIGAYVIVRHIARVELWDSGVALLRGVRAPHSRVVVALLYPLIDAALLGATLLFTYALMNPDWEIKDILLTWLDKTALWCGLPFIGLCISSTYSRVWSRSRTSEFALIGLVLCASITLCLGLEIIIYRGQIGLTNLVLFGVVYGALSPLLILGYRAFPRLVEDLMEFSPPPSSNVDTPRRILLYGAGERACSFLRFKRAHGKKPEIYVGFIDDDVSLRKRLVFGLQVLGTGYEIPRILDRYRVTDLVFTTEIAKEKKEPLLTLCQDKGILPYDWIVEERPVLAAALLNNENFERTGNLAEMP